MIKFVNRGNSTVADAYLTPVLREYIDTFFEALEGGKEQGECKVEYMSSDGGLVEAKSFSGLRSILSGPAGEYKVRGDLTCNTDGQGGRRSRGLLINVLGREG